MNPSYGYPGTYNQFNTYNSYGPNYYNPNLNPPSYIGQPGHQVPQVPNYGYQPTYPQTPAYNLPSQNQTPYNPYASSSQPTASISLGSVTFQS